MNTIKKLWDEHPNLTSFVVLSIGMLIILFFSTRHVGFTALQWLVLALATILLAGLCIWIIGWEVGDSIEDDVETNT